MINKPNQVLCVSASLRTSQKELKLSGQIISNLCKSVSIRGKFSRWSLAIENRQLEIVNLKFLPAYKAAYPALAAKNNFCLPPPVIYVPVRHHYLCAYKALFWPFFLVPFCGYKNLRNLWLISLHAIRV